MKHFDTTSTYVIRDRWHWADFLPWFEGWTMKAQIRMQINLEQNLWYGSPIPPRGFTYFFPAVDPTGQKKRFDNILTAGTKLHK